MVVFGTDPFLARPRRKMFLVVFVVSGMVKVTCSGSVLSPSPTLQHVRDLPEFATLMSLNCSNWSRSLLWHGWLPGLSDKDPWASSFGDPAFSSLERCLGAYPADFSSSWIPPDYWDADDIASEMSEHPNIWTDGSREDFSSVGGYEVAGAVFICLLLRLPLKVLSEVLLKSMGMFAWSVAVLFLPVPGVLQTVQRAEFWGAILALQAYWPCHLGIDNRNVKISPGIIVRQHHTDQKHMGLLKEQCAE